jgi:hypothetical protein
MALNVGDGIAADSSHSIVSLAIQFLYLRVDRLLGYPNPPWNKFPRLLREQRLPTTASVKQDSASRHERGSAPSEDNSALAEATASKAH